MKSYDIFWELLVYENFPVLCKVAMQASPPWSDLDLVQYLKSQGYSVIYNKYDGIDCLRARRIITFLDDKENLKFILHYS